MSDRHYVPAVGTTTAVPPSEWGMLKVTMCKQKYIPTYLAYTSRLMYVCLGRLYVDCWLASSLAYYFPQNKVVVRVRIRGKNGACSLPFFGWVYCHLHDCSSSLECMLPSTATMSQTKVKLGEGSSARAWQWSALHGIAIRVVQGLYQR